MEEDLKQKQTERERIIKDIKEQIVTNPQVNYPHKHLCYSQIMCYKALTILPLHHPSKAGILQCAFDLQVAHML